MDRNFEKVLDSGRRVVVDLKRKYSDQGFPYCARATNLHFPLQSSTASCYPELPKRKRLDVSGSCAFPSGRQLIKYYSNFKKSGILQRLLYYQNDEWNDFSETVIASVNKDLVKKPAIEVQDNDSRILLDFLHMVQLDMDTGLQQPIAWIDVNGNCFFPDIFGDSVEHTFDSHHVEGNISMGAMSQGHNDVNLHLEIQVHAFGNESSGESVAISESVKTCGNATPKICDYEVFDSGVKDEDDTKLPVNERMRKNMNLEVDGVLGSFNFDVVRDMFFKAIKSNDAEIVQMRFCKSVFMESHLELFKKQVKITKKYRGDANVLSAWFPCPRGIFSSILKFGIGQCNQSKDDLLNGVGIHLIPANGTQFSISNIDVDENGERHVVLCRVIMGNMEVVPSASDQFHPSGDNFDSGVDNLQNPSHYVVWSMNMNSHIHPDCIVSFRVAPEIEGPVSGQETGVGVSNSIPGSERLHAQRRIPKSPWMPFALLFASISNSVSPQSMETVRIYYESFKRKSISRDEFIKKLRLIVGDAVLKSAITSLRQEISEPSTSIIETS